MLGKRSDGMRAISPRDREGKKREGEIETQERNIMRLSWGSFTSKTEPSNA
jgi:hypothetical protein